MIPARLAQKTRGIRMDNQNNFIMLPTNDFCFKELMQNPKVLARMKCGEAISDESIIQWMEFFSGKTQEDFKTMAKQNEYMEEAVNTLFELSADEKKRLEYEAREKAIRDYNTQMQSAEQRGLERGMECGKELGMELAIKALTLRTEGMSLEQIASACDMSLEQVKRILTSV